MPKITAIDSHVHIYPDWDIDVVLNTAYFNLSKNTPKKPDVCVLFLSEICGHNFFEKAKDKNGDLWEIQHTEEKNSLKAVYGNKEIIIIAGRQIKTKDNIEILALGLLEEKKDGLDADEILSSLAKPDNNVLSILPFSAGKWLGKRGKKVKAILNENKYHLLMGDIKDRPFLFAYEPIFKLAKKNNIKIIRGSDPLYFEDEINKIGSFGFYINDIPDIKKPAASLIKMLIENDVAMTPFGKHVNFYNFIKTQLKLNFLKNKKNNFPVVAEEEKPDIDSSSFDYQKRFAGETGKWFLDIQNKATCALLKETATKTIIDIGGGHGQTLPMLLKKGYAVTILGSDECCTCIIKDYIEDQKTSFVKAPLTKSGYEDNSFDTVLSYRILPHMHNWRKLICELSRISRNNIMVDFPAVRSVNIFSVILFSLKKKIEKNTRTFTIFNENNIKQEFAKYGFFTKTKYPQFLLPMAFHRALKNKSISALLEKIFRFTGLTYFFGSPIIYLFEKEK